MESKDEIINSFRKSADEHVNEILSQSYIDLVTELAVINKQRALLHSEYIRDAELLNAKRISAIEGINAIEDMISGECNDVLEEIPSYKPSQPIINRDDTPKEDIFLDESGISSINKSSITDPVSNPKGVKPMILLEEQTLTPLRVFSSGGEVAKFVGLSQSTVSNNMRENRPIKVLDNDHVYECYVVPLAKVILDKSDYYQIPFTMRMEAVGITYPATDLTSEKLLSFSDEEAISYYSKRVIKEPIKQTSWVVE